jgi:hypothetical protein
MIQSRPVPARLLFLWLVTLAASGCKSTGGLPPIEGVRPADDARASLLASVSIAPVDALVGDVDGLSRTLGLPFAGKDLVTMLAAQSRLDPQTFAHIDTARPVGMAFVAPAAREQPPLEAVALSTRPGAAEKLVAALGTVSEKTKGASKVTRADGSTVWVVAHGDSLYASGTLDGLVAAATLAIEAQRPPANDLMVSLFPDAFARWRGTDVRTALAGLRKELMDDQIAAAQRRGGPVPGAAERLAYETAIDTFIQPMAETASGALTLDLDPARGLRFGLRLQPRPGSAFGKQMATPTPYLADPALFAVADGSSLAALWAVGPSPFWLGLYERILDAQARAGTRGAAEVARHFQGIRPQLAGSASGAVRAQRGALSSDVVLPLRAGASGRLLDALAALAGSRGFTELLGEIYGRAAPQVRVQRERETLRSELAFPLRERRGDVGTVLKAFFGSPTIATVASVSGGRVLVATEPAAASRLASLSAAAPARAPAPEVAGALAETKGQDGLLYLDLWSFAKPAIGVAAPPGQAQAVAIFTSMPAFAQLKLPVVMSYRGGKTLDAELRIPLATLTNAANVIKPFVGASVAR